MQKYQYSSTSKLLQVFYFKKSLKPLKFKLLHCTSIFFYNFAIFSKC